jgi:hypothetical protein
MTVAPMAPPDVAIRALKQEHDDLHALWKQHVQPSRCPRCANGSWCRVAGDLADRANTAGLRWQRAERDAKRADAVQRALDAGIAWA